jgi:hypothetical protein
LGVDGSGFHHRAGEVRVPVGELGSESAGEHAVGLDPLHEVVRAGASQGRFIEALHNSTHIRDIPLPHGKILPRVLGSHCVLELFIQSVNNIDFHIDGRQFLRRYATRSNENK